MSSASNKISRYNLEPGDHIYSWRRLHTYAHHGIYVGENQVIHFLTRGDGRNGIVERTDLDSFLDGGNLRRYQYGVASFKHTRSRGGTSTTVNSEPPIVVVNRAQSLLQNGVAEYNLFTNNCEQFSLYCKTGVWNIPCGQVQGFLHNSVAFAKVAGLGLIGSLRGQS